MNDDDRLLLDVRSWLKDEDVVLPDAEQAGRLVAIELPRTRQLRRKWWPLPSLRGTSVPPPVMPDTEYQPTSIPATNGHSPTATGRTQSMFSPAKAITAGALVFALGGVLLIAQPFDQQGEGVPAAETTDLVEPVEFTLVIGQANKAGLPATCDVVDGANHCRDARPPVAITEASDPWLDGQLTVSLSQIQYLDHPWFTTTTFRIFNDGGAWACGRRGLRGPVCMDGCLRLECHQRGHLPHRTAGGHRPFPSEY